MLSLIGQNAPDFDAVAVMEDGQIEEKFNFKEYIKDSYAVLFFYPMDFTFVCPSEIISFNNFVPELKEKNTKVIGISVDSQYSHVAWRDTPVENGGIGPVSFPLVADFHKRIASAYGVLHKELGVSFRATFVIDKKGVIRSQVVNDLPIGRNNAEVIRVLDAIEFHEEFGDVCPAGWQKGDEGMKADKEGVANYLSKNASKL